MIFYKEKPLAEYKGKSGKKFSLQKPNLNQVQELLEFTNRLIEEDTFLNLTGKPISFLSERRWLEDRLKEIARGDNYFAWAFNEKRMVGSVSVIRAKTRSSHVGEIGLMVDKDFRGEGLGQFLLEFILQVAKKMKMQIVIVEVFADNVAALVLYKKFGFKEYGRLPKGLLRQGKYSDQIELYKNISSSFAKASEDK